MIHKSQQQNIYYLLWLIIYNYYLFISFSTLIGFLANYDKILNVAFMKVVIENTFFFMMLYKDY